MKRVRLIKRVRLAKKRKAKGTKHCLHCNAPLELLPGGAVYECTSKQCGWTFHRNELLGQ